MPQNQKQQPVWLPPPPQQNIYYVQPPEPPKVRKFHPGLAAVMSLFLPGLGQLYKSQPFWALFWFLSVPVSYLFLIIPGLIMHALCVLWCLSGDPFE